MDTTRVVSKLLLSYPDDVVSSLEFNLSYSELYRFREGTWLNDGTARALTQFLQSTCKNNATVLYHQKPPVPYQNK